MGEDLQAEPMQGELQDITRRRAVRIERVSNGYVIGGGPSMQKKIAKTLEEVFAIVKEEFEK